ncbi:MAG: hypothetical protein R3C10_26130 [Pirellulales bacterium]
MQREMTTTDPHQTKRTARNGKSRSMATGRRTTRSLRRKTVQHTQPNSLANVASSRRFRKVVRPELHYAETGPSLMSLQPLFVFWGYFTSAGILLLCGLDLAFGVPFDGLEHLFDLAFAACGVALLWMSWHTQREFSRFVNSSMR